MAIRDWNWKFITLCKRLLRRISAIFWLTLEHLYLTRVNRWRCFASLSRSRRLSGVEERGEREESPGSTHHWMRQRHVDDRHTGDVCGYFMLTGPGSHWSAWPAVMAGGRRGLVAPQNTFLENIVRRSNGKTHRHIQSSAHTKRLSAVVSQIKQRKNKLLGTWVRD